MKKAWMIGPVLWFVGLALLLVTWAVLDPATLVANFDNDGRSPFELATLPVFAAIVPLVWCCNPFTGSRKRRTVLAALVTLVAVMAIVKELDLHNMAMHALWPDLIGDDGSVLASAGLRKPNGSLLTGTPFKMRVLTNAGVPVGMKAWIVLYFVAFFGVFAAGFAYLFKIWLLGVFKLVPSAWSFGCLGASGVIVQVADRLPSWLGHRFGDFSTARAMCTALEEGFEMMIAVFAIITICQGFRELRGQVRHFAV